MTVVCGYEWAAAASEREGRQALACARDDGRSGVRGTAAVSGCEG